KSQDAVNTGVTVNDLVTAISGPGVIITNANLNCPNGAYGTFSGGAGSKMDLQKFKFSFYSI
ncbi:MAG: hypothetical protein KDD50_13175, partial [Bdellovibrionales bacterium]|nr:hypothetical protein [Bdellovibrionales bacterium]